MSYFLFVVQPNLIYLLTFNQKQYLWQDSAVVIDSYKGASMIGKIEKWIRMKESHLEYKQSELERSAQEIQNTLDRLTQERSEN